MTEQDGSERAPFADHRGARRHLARRTIRDWCRSAILPPRTADAAGGSALLVRHMQSDECDIQLRAHCGASARIALLR